jgi:hypothetical protein
VEDWKPAPAGIDTNQKILTVPSHQANALLLAATEL